MCRGLCCVLHGAFVVLNDEGKEADDDDADDDHGNDGRPMCRGVIPIRKRSAVACNWYV